MPHIYLKTIGLVVLETVLLLVRLGQAAAFFHIPVLANTKIMEGIMAIPGAALDVALVTIAIAVIINEKLGERWGAGAYALLLFGFIVTMLLRLSIG